MNHIKSLLGIISIVLAMMLLPLEAEAQTVAVPPGTDPSVKLIGQMYIETGNHVKVTQNLDNIGNIAEGIANKYLDKIRSCPCPGIGDRMTAGTTNTRNFILP